MEDLVSVLVPVYRVENYVGRCAESLFRQDYKNLEYIFVDDCSPDRSVDVINRVLDSYPHRRKQVQIITHSENKGLSEARNTAVAHAKGEYLMHVDSDDYINKETITEVMSELKNSGADAAIFAMKHIYADKEVESVDSLPYSGELVTDFVNRIICRDVAAYVCGGIYKTALYKENGIVAISGINVGEDYATKPRLLYNAERIIGIPKAYYNYVHYNQGSYSKNFSEKSVYDFRRALDVLNDYFYDKGQEFAQSLKTAEIRLRSELLLSWGCYGGRECELELIRKEFNPDKVLFSKLCLKYRIANMLSQCGIALKLYCLVGMKIKHFYK